MDSRAVGVPDRLNDIRRLAVSWSSDRLTAADRAEMAAEFGKHLADLRAAGWTGLLGWRFELPDELLPDWYLSRRLDTIDALEKDLARFAEGWGRSRANPSQREMYYEAYVAAMEELFRIGHWSGEPDAESHLPYDLMPKVYRDFWEVKHGHWTA